MSMENDKLRKCGHCQEWKPFDEFHNCPRGVQGKHTVCKPCRVKYNGAKFGEWKKQNREKYNAAQRAYRARKRSAKESPDV